MIVLVVNNQGVPIRFNIGQENEPVLDIAIMALMVGSLVSGMLRPDLYKRLTQPITINEQI